MADQKRWFKVWSSILNDQGFHKLGNEFLGIWCRLGCLICQQGSNGKIEAEISYFEDQLKCKFDAILMLPNVVIEEVKSDNGRKTVTIKNWNKYQLDSTGYERIKKFRKHLNDNGLREDKIREDKTKIRIPPISPKNSFDIFWKSYPKKTGKQAALKAWQKSKSKPPIEIIIQKIEQQKKSDQWLKENGQYIPNPATWINQGRWDDEVTNREVSWIEQVNKAAKEYGL